MSPGSYQWNKGQVVILQHYFVSGAGVMLLAASIAYTISTSLALFLHVLCYHDDFTNNTCTFFTKDFNLPHTPEPNPPQLEGEYFGMDDDLEWQGLNGQMNFNDCGDLTDEEHSDDGRDNDGFNEWEPPPAQGPHSTCLNGSESSNSELPCIPDMPEDSNTDNIYAPFTSKIDWEMAQWAKLQGPSSTAFSDLLSIESTRDLWVLDSLTHCPTISMTLKHKKAAVARA
ncbi:uncharacterized protein BJ212DRAFT_1294494 [Suillus subaureus]|uniref:Uncharacterized protein n=1 Tax=Suillus subaureus TaxID=48587 RepID=A0A9P7JKE9_9AGAM|nr:uncharacterized protein BJ212DRAFT_1294494 [Suillus subaureus]KAG1827144.1 hypothetical protein BJ212DRAFT_1294494 [Suillus subaureus]